MPLWKNGEFTGEDGWDVTPDDLPLPVDGPALISLTRWRAERATLAARNAPIGLLLQPGDDWSDVAADLSRFPLIAVAFPKFTDGRGFSITRLLRDRDGYAGEIRAVGSFILDQIPLMRRVGIDSFAIQSPTVVRELGAGVWPEVPYYMQPIADAREAPAGTRPWIRRPTKVGF